MFTSALAAQRNMRSKKIKTVKSSCVVWLLNCDCFVCVSCSGCSDCSDCSGCSGCSAHCIAHIAHIVHIAHIAYIAHVASAQIAFITHFFARCLRRHTITPTNMKINTIATAIPMPAYMM